MEEIILQNAKAHRRVTRQDVVGLCRVNENQAANLFKKLVKGREPHRIRMGRAAAYTSLNSE